MSLALGLGMSPLALGQTTISSGTYTGADGTTGSSVGDDGGSGGTGSPGYTADGSSGNGAPYTFTGGTFTGGSGGTAGHGRVAGGSGGMGGDALDIGADTTITGGTFVGGDGSAGGAGGIGVSAGGDGGEAVDTLSGTVDIYGGTFTGGSGNDSGVHPPRSNGYSFYVSGGDVNLYGTFNPASESFITGTGSFTGTLADNTIPATYTYDVVGGELTLDPSPVPEPTCIAVLGVTAVALLARRQRSI